MLKLGFLGNCQAQALEGWLRQVPDQIELVTLPPIWLVEEQDVPDILERIQTCDVLFAQRLSEDFARRELVTSRLKAEFGDRLVSWPNIYFDGYFPGISYRYSEYGRIHGPLDEYHWDLIESAWREGVDAETCVKRLTGDAIFERYPDPVSQSLGNLANRERGLDVGIADYLAANLHWQRLFYSMNHPVNELLFEMLHRLFAYIGERKRIKGLGEYGFPLNKIILPVLPAISRRYRINFGENDVTRGVDIEFGDRQYTVKDDEKIYNFSELVDSFYRVYDINERQS